MAEKSCWFYDNQLLDRMTCVSLHANTYRTEKDGKQIWRKFVEDQGKAVDRGGYCKIPLCTSILGDDFQVSVSNNWVDGGEGDFIKEAWTKFAQPLAPYIKTLNPILQDAGEQAKRWQRSRDENKKGFGNLMAKGIAALGDLAAKNGEAAVDYLNAVLISQGTRFKYYSGTGISFGNLQMRFTMFPIWTSENVPTFLTVPQQLENLFPYVIGEYSNFQITDKNRNGHMEDSAMLGWQKPPGGYQMDMQDIDKAGIKGTLKLRIGSFYVLESILCESLSFSLSKQMVKRPANASWTNLQNGDGKGIKVDDQMIFSPLFADVVMSFVPATKYSDRSMRQFIYGLNINGDENEGGREASRQLSDNLTAEVERLKSIYGDGDNV